MCLVWRDKTGFHRNVLSCLLSQPAYRDILFHIYTQLESNKLPLYKLHNFTVVIII